MEAKKINKLEDIEMPKRAKLTDIVPVYGLNKMADRLSERRDRLSEWYKSQRKLLTNGLDDSSYEDIELKLDTIKLDIEFEIAFDAFYFIALSALNVAYGVGAFKLIEPVLKW